jgi:hypothetical protein
MNLKKIQKIFRKKPEKRKSGQKRRCPPGNHPWSLTTFAASPVTIAAQASNALARSGKSAAWL